MSTENMSKPIPVVIDRSRWLRGEGEIPSKLLRKNDNKMCCLGFCCLALGLSEDDIREVDAPYSLSGRGMDVWLGHMLGHMHGLERSPPVPVPHPYAIGSAMEVNDNDPDEGELTELLAPWFTLEFVDGPVES